VLSADSTSRYTPLKKDFSGITMLRDSTPGEAEELVVAKPPKIGIFLPLLFLLCSSCFSFSLFSLSLSPYLSSLLFLAFFFLPLSFSKEEQTALF